MTIDSETLRQQTAVAALPSEALHAATDPHSGRFHAVIDVHGSITYRGRLSFGGSVTGGGRYLANEGRERLDDRRMVHWRDIHHPF